MPTGVLIDTSFAITLAVPKRAHHDAARKYWKHFLDSGMPIYLSTIVVSEFSVKQQIPDEIRLACILLPFNWADAIRSAKFDNTREKEEGVERQAVKDDIKILAHAACQDVEFVIADDKNTFFKYAVALRDKGLVKFTAINLESGFDISHFNQGQQDMLTKQGV